MSRTPPAPSINFPCPLSSLEPGMESTHWHSERYSFSSPREKEAAVLSPPWSSLKENRAVRYGLYPRVSWYVRARRRSRLWSLRGDSWSPPTPPPLVGETRDHRLTRGRRRGGKEGEGGSVSLQ